MSRRYSVAEKATIAGTTVRPIGSIMAVASRSGFLLEAGIFNTTAVSCVYALKRITAAGTPGADITEVTYHNSDGDAPDLTAKAGHTADATMAAGAFRIARLGASIGSGVIYKFDWPGIFIPAGTANGIGWTLYEGTGQICDFYYDWVE